MGIKTTVINKKKSAPVPANKAIKPGSKAAKITLVGGHKLRLASFECGCLGSVAKKDLDVTPHAGQYVRIWLDSDGSYSLDPKKDHLWQVAELQVPPLQYEDKDTGLKDPETGEPIMAGIALPLDLEGLEIKVWPLPEQSPSPPGRQPPGASIPLP